MGQQRDYGEKAWPKLLEHIQQLRLQILALFLPLPGIGNRLMPLVKQGA